MVIPRGIGTFGSRSTAVAGTSVHNNSVSVRDNARRIAAHFLEAAAADVTLTNGRFHVLGVPERSLSWVEIAAAANDESLPATLQGGLEPGRILKEQDFTGKKGCWLSAN